MRVAAYHNLLHGGAFRAAIEQFSRLGNWITDIYTNADVVQSGPAALHHYPVRLKRLLRSPFGRLNGFVNLANLGTMTRVCRRIAHDIDAEGFDVVLVNACRVTQTPPILKFLQTPTVHYSHGPFRAMHEALLIGDIHLPYSDPARVLYSRAIVANEYAALRRANTVLCNSYYTREHILYNYGVQAKVNYLGIDAHILHPIGQNRGNYVLSVGRLSFLKGHDFVIDSLARIDASRRPELRIVYAPHDSAENDLRKMSELKGVKITFWSDISDDELAALYSSAICTTFAPVLEEFGLVPLESMACGTPTVGIREAGLRETITHGVTGFLSDREPSEFAEYIEHLMLDPQLTDSMGKAGREYVVSTWNWEKSICELESVLEMVAKHR